MRLCFVALLAGVFGETIYSARKLESVREDAEPFRVFEKNGVHVYLDETEESITNAPLPFMIQRLRGIPEIVLEKGEKKYHIRPFERVDVESEEGRRCLGRFHGIKNKNNEVVVTYDNRDNRGGGMYSKCVVIFSPSSEDKIERVYSGWSDSCVLKVSVARLNIKHRKKTLSVYSREPRRDLRLGIDQEMKILNNPGCEENEAVEEIVREEAEEIVPDAKDASEAGEGNEIVPEAESGGEEWREPEDAAQEL